MTIRTWRLVVAVCVALCGILSISAAQKPAPSNTKPAATDLLPLTCVQAWAKSNRDYAGLRSIVVTLARVSLANRNLTFPNTREAGLQAGREIAEDCKTDPNALLFAIVDKHVRSVAGAASGGPK
jgi:hypothetical protein